MPVIKVLFYNRPQFTRDKNQSREQSQTEMQARGGKVAHAINVPAAKFDDLYLISWTHVVEGEI